MNNRNKLIAILVGGAVFIASCNKDEHNHNDHDSINQVIIKLNSSNDSTEMKFYDPDGDGGIAPTITGAKLKKNQTYNATVSLYTAHDNHLDDITSEILNEGAEHQLFYISSLGIQISYGDTDVNGKPIGLNTIWKTSVASIGKFQVVLRHEPDKNASGVANGQIANAGGESDIDIEFDIIVE